GHTALLWIGERASSADGRLGLAGSVAALYEHTDIAIASSSALSRVTLIIPATPLPWSPRPHGRARQRCPAIDKISLNGRKPAREAGTENLDVFAVMDGGPITF